VAQALYRKWRPSSFDDVVGQDHVTTTLKNQIATGRIGHAYLFVGSRGCGKTTSARIFAKEVNIVGLDEKRAQQIGDAISEGRAIDVIEIDAASHTGVDAIREIIDKVAFQPTELRYKVYVVDEVHMLSNAAFNALLKTLEEPPPHVLFILATTDPQKIPATVLSRCQRFTFMRVPIDKIVNRLRVLCTGENIEADDHALRMIARHATGSLRDAVSLLDQLASSNSMRITAADVREALGATDAATVKALTDGLIERNVSAGFDAIQAAVDQGADARQIARQMVEYLRALIQIKVSRSEQKGELSEAERIELSAQAERIEMPLLTRAVKAFSNAINEMRGTTDAQLPLEMSYLNCVVTEEKLAVRGEESGERSEKIEVKIQNPEPRSQKMESKTQLASESWTASNGQHIANVETTSVSRGDAHDVLHKNWQSFIKDVNANNKAAAALLRSCKPHDVVGKIVQIRADHDLAKQRLDAPANKSSVIGALKKLLGGDYELDVFVGQPPVSPEDDPLLKAAKKLGGQVRQ
jgi:DNA polymerase-3 subunit gamma/tau